jgi:hypothetical protein
MSKKIILTNVAVLQAKYGASYGKIEAALKKLIAADKARSLETIIVPVDDAAAMAKYGAKAVLNSASFKQNKDAIDKVYQATVPDYLVILGAPDVIPHQDLKNPLQSADDPDSYAWGDIPYACEAPYSNDPKKFIGPTRVLGRIPDLLAGSDPAYLVKLLGIATQWKSRTPEEYADHLGISAKVWRDSTALSLQNTFGTSARLQLSPPKGPKWTPAQLGCLAHFINCHGALSTPHFFGQTGTKYPKAHSAALIAGHVSEGTVVAAECCYGAELYDPTHAEGGQMGISNTYLQGGAYGFLGSSTIAYGPATGNGSADLICQYFLQSVKAGASLGRAALEARQKFAKSAPQLDPADVKTLAQFYLLGDPSIQPVTAPAVHHSMALVKAMRANKAKMTTESFDRKTRRQQLFEEGTQIAQTKSVASLDRFERVSASVVKMMKDLAAEAGIVADKMISFKIDRPTPPAKLAFKSIMESFDSPDAFHVISGRVGGGPESVVDVAIVIGKEQGGEIVSMRKLLSR